MKNLLNKLRQRLSGCCGPDALSAFLITLSAVFVLAAYFPRLRWRRFAAVLLLVFALYRMLSGNRQKRSAENRLFLDIRKKIKDRFALRVKMVKEYRTHRYLRCPSCRAVLRVKRDKGQHTVACPHCGSRFDTVIR